MAQTEAKELPALDDMIDILNLNHLAIDESLVLQLEDTQSPMRQNRLARWEGKGIHDYGTFNTPARCIVDLDGQLCITQDVYSPGVERSLVTGGELIAAKDRMPIFRRPFAIHAVGKQLDGMLYDVCGDRNRVQVYQSRANRLIKWDVFNDLHRRDAIHIGPNGPVMVSSKRIKKLGEGLLVENLQVDLGVSTTQDDYLYVRSYEDQDRRIPLLKMSLKHETDSLRVVHFLKVDEPSDEFSLQRIRVSLGNRMYYQISAKGIQEIRGSHVTDETSNLIVRMKQGFSISNYAIYEKGQIKS